MFGLVVANPDSLLPGAAAHYRAVYCGLCDALGENRSAVNRLSLTYDLAFLAIVLSSAENEGFEVTQKSCVIHPLKKHRCEKNGFVAYAADMNILLAYYKCLDDVADDGSVYAKLKASLFRKAAAEVEEKYPRQAQVIEDCLARLSEAEMCDEQIPDIPAGIFGELMAALFSPDGVSQSEELAAFGEALGRVIYLMDAAVDLRHDIKKQSYNPLVSISPDTVPLMLRVQLGFCEEKFRALKITADRDIMENILYSGIWTAFAAIKRKENDNG